MRKSPKIPVRSIRVEGDVAYVALSQGRTALIDSADAEMVGKWNWTAEVSHSGRCAAVRRGRDKKAVFLHRLIVDAPPDRYVDHINGDSLDNRRANLRLATHAQNIRNMRPRPERLLPMGVCQEKRTGAYTAAIGFEMRFYHLGTFKTMPEALAARHAAAILLHGEFTRATALSNLHLLGVAPNSELSEMVVV